MNQDAGNQNYESDETKVMRLLEERPLTIENVAYALDVPIERARQLVEELWRQGSATTLDGMMFSKIFPVGRRQQTTFNSQARYTLTLSGHFHLHPIISGSANG